MHVPKAICEKIVPRKNSMVFSIILVRYVAVGTAAILSFSISQHPGGSAHYTPLRAIA
jgi:hypothetical protein